MKMQAGVWTFEKLAGDKAGDNELLAVILGSGCRHADVLAPYLNPEAVRALWNAHVGRAANHGYLLWTLLTLAVWRESAGVR